jgi:type II secretory ATPase GspE/PulE/Tfp pilus assembly ATPase PilB-like protein
MFAMRLLEELLYLAQSIQAHDLHIIPQKNQDPYVLFRQEKKHIQSRSLKRSDWTQLVEYIKFHGHYRYEDLYKFQDLQLQVFNYSLRVAFTPGPLPYITCRIHQGQSLKPLNPTIKDFIDTWLKQTGMLIIAGPVKSGKTTLYYQLLRYVALTDHTVMSLEDPIECLFDDITQYSLRADHNIHEIAHSLLRFDLDIVGIGEARQLSCLTALTHLSLSSIKTICTFHATDFITLSKKLTILAQHDYERFHYCFYGAILLKNLFEEPICSDKYDNHFNNVFRSTLFQ